MSVGAAVGTAVACCETFRAVCEYLRRDGEVKWRDGAGHCGLVVVSDGWAVCSDGEDWCGKRRKEELGAGGGG